MHILFFSFLVVAFSARADVHLECQHERSAGLVWEEKLLTRPAGMGLDYGDGGDDRITLMVSGEKALLKGNVGTSVLVKVDDYFMEPTGAGNITTWKYFPPMGDVPPYLIQMLAFRIEARIHTLTTAWKCRLLAK